MDILDRCLSRLGDRHFGFEASNGVNSHGLSPGCSVVLKIGWLAGQAVTQAVPFQVTRTEAPAVARVATVALLRGLRTRTEKAPVAPDSRRISRVSPMST